VKLIIFAHMSIIAENLVKIGLSRCEIIDQLFWLHIFADCISRDGNEIGITSARLPVSLFPVYLLNRLTFDLGVLHVHGS